MVAPYLILAGLWLVYFVLHSLLVSSEVRRHAQCWLGKSYRYYRLGYNFIAVITIVPILLYNSLISNEPLVGDVRVRDILQLFGLVLASYGVIVIHLSFKQFSKREFLGLSALDTDQKEPLQTGGILRYVRHPLYSGTILIALGLWCFSPTVANLITASAWIIYILVGIRIEEKKLLELYGDEYQKYKENVPMLIPRLRSPRY
ncbi:MAG: isoprenylcysteine carboxylmethyltransferase family protein [Bacteroidota bacterium]